LFGAGKKRNMALELGLSKPGDGNSIVERGR
jgi:hypothetical protein